MYDINGIPLLLLPERGRWVPREQVGVDGQRRPLYEPTRSFKLEWGLMSPLQFNQLCNFYEEVSATGTVTIVLPAWCGDSWTGTVYEGLLEEPQPEVYWNENHFRVSMMVVKITTD